MSAEDVAQELEAAAWARINIRPGAHERELFAPEDPRYGPEFCQDEACGEEMPDLRRAYGFTLCVSCKEIIERQAGARVAGS